MELTNQELLIIEKWRRQFRHRWLACWVFGAVSIINMASGGLMLFHVVRLLLAGGVPLKHAITLDWFPYLGEPDTSRLLILFLLAIMQIMTFVLVVAFLLTTFRVTVPRYRLVEKLLDRPILK